MTMTHFVVVIVSGETEQGTTCATLRRETTPTSKNMVGWSTRSSAISYVVQALEQSAQLGTTFPIS